MINYKDADAKIKLAISEAHHVAVNAINLQKQTSITSVQKVLKSLSGNLRENKCMNSASASYFNGRRLICQF